MRKYISNGMKIKKVMLFGTFDIIHPGHINLFWQAQKLGDYIIVVVARDKTVIGFKKRKPASSEKTRALRIRKSGLADHVTLGSLKDKYAAIKKYKPDIIALGYDQKFLTEGLAGKVQSLGLKTKIYRLKPYKPHIHKTSKILAYETRKQKFK